MDCILSPYFVSMGKTLQYLSFGGFFWVGDVWLVCLFGLVFQCIVVF